MQNALHEPQTIVLLGGTSEIGRAIVDELVSASARTLVLACRRPDEARPDHFARDGLDVVVEPFDAAATDTHDEFARRLAAEHGDLDVVILAFGVLGDQAEFDDDPQAAADAVHVNFTGGVSASLAFTGVMRRQGHGHLAVLSSVAGERVRAANYVYGSSKAGLDAFAQGLGDALAGSGVQVTVIRPGFVHSRMTRGMKAAPFATTPRVVGELAVAGMRSGRHTVWTPGVLRYVFSVLRHVPRTVFRRLPLG
ncbi:SDR family NAD(P)-dependent oxidoreductase [Ilumatobacter sp.]|uniref:SDR family NAD(P)-dependent oxidoreductase n=1 Tax=Ilumatobacter sp. TaxID=1967498 RepID=UPI003AF50E40